MTTATSSIKAVRPGISLPTTRPPSPRSLSAPGHRSSLKAVGIRVGEDRFDPLLLFILHRSKDNRNFHICASQYPQCSPSDGSCFRTIFVALLVFQLLSAFEGRS